MGHLCYKWFNSANREDERRGRRGPDVARWSPPTIRRARAIAWAPSCTMLTMGLSIAARRATHATNTGSLCDYMGHLRAPKSTTCEPGVCTAAKQVSAVHWMICKPMASRRPALNTHESPLWVLHMRHGPNGPKNGRAEATCMRSWHRIK